MQYDCVIIGGGIAGLQAAIQLGRYRHKVAVIDASGGRSNLCRCYHNIIGWPDGVSGSELLASGRKQAQRLQVRMIEARAVEAAQERERFAIVMEDGGRIYGRRLLLATGVKDRLPDFPALMPCLGVTVYICPDCDGYEISDRKTIVIGSGKAGAEMALALTFWTDELIYVNHELAALDVKEKERLEAKKIAYVEKAVRSVMTEDDRFQGVVLEDGTMIACDRCFLALGGNEVLSGIAGQLGAELTDNRHIKVDPRTKMTSVKHVWAAGDVTPHSEMATIAMGDGSQAAIWIHKSLLEVEQAKPSVPDRA
ncbi:NAD(P)/FAD-dependent oxidoreductase [Paenibacillus arenilitoris]|uniref:NAD(P)/FAD-dependent oxidoreductase n=1 Tax=Paenibacillus arenilitoris TaxID=2772299 RepID=A0A927CN62_9BACL|nr:NAD(P)/FAD-dependent oxidoreductase [Paenibacillus arenilitoris]MBD2869932.1 NAD(P)/FAD-dependent oxidoreductase [Paenibacillus arenilitoris]